MFIILFLVFAISLFFVYVIDKNLNKVIETYIDVEAERLTNNIVNNEINEIIGDDKSNDFLLYDNSDKENIKISYDVVKINKLKNELTKRIEKRIMDLDNGNIDEYFIPKRIKNGKFKNLKKGILCDVSLGSIRGSTLFANIGPTIPIKLLFSSQIKTDIDIEVKEYGINNVIIEMYYIVYIKDQITMPITSKRKKIKVKEIFAVDIVSGSIPNYYGGYIK